MEASPTAVLLDETDGAFFEPLRNDDAGLLEYGCLGAVLFRCLPHGRENLSVAERPRSRTPSRGGRASRARAPGGRAGLPPAGRLRVSWITALRSGSGGNGSGLRRTISRRSIPERSPSRASSAARGAESARPHPEPGIARRVGDASPVSRADEHAEAAARVDRPTPAMTEPHALQLREGREEVLREPFERRLVLVAVWPDVAPVAVHGVVAAPQDPPVARRAVVVEEVAHVCESLPRPPADLLPAGLPRSARSSARSRRPVRRAAAPSDSDGYALVASSTPRALTSARRRRPARRRRCDAASAPVNARGSGSRPRRPRLAGRRRAAPDRRARPRCAATGPPGRPGEPTCALNCCFVEQLDVVPVFSQQTRLVLEVGDLARLSATAISPEGVKSQSMPWRSRSARAAPRSSPARAARAPGSPPESARAR